jgi:tRNA modification GTPase
MTDAELQMVSDSRLPTAGSACCAVLTPSGRGAIATVALRGAAALAAVARRFQPAAGKTLDAYGPGRVVFGHFRMSETAVEEIVVGLIATDELEIHCHGGTAAVAAICSALVAEGCVLVTADEWVHSQQHDPIAAQALLALAEARTEHVAVILLDQHHGALRAELSLIERLIAQNETVAAAQAIDRLLARAELGLHLTQPWKVVLAGAPNAGKSSLANAILGYERAIVFPQPGTTRDVLTATTAIGGWPVELADIAGLRTAADAIEAEGVGRAWRQISAADLVIYVAATTEPWDASLYQRVAQLHRLRLVIVHNKCDLLPPPVDGRPERIEVSAKTGLGIDKLCSAISYSLVPSPLARGAAVPFASEHIIALKEAAASLSKGECTAAGDWIASALYRPRDAASDYNGGPST